VFRPGEHFEVMFACPMSDHPGDASHPSFDLLQAGVGTGVVPEVGSGPLDLNYAMPPEAVGMGYVEHIVRPEAWQTDAQACPGRGEDTIGCKLDWEARVVMRKTGEKGDPAPAPPKPAPTPDNDDDLLVPLVPPKPAPEADDDLLVPLVPQGKASLNRRGDAASFSVGCPSGCSGTGTVQAGAGGGAHASAVTRQRFRFTVAKGKTRRVSVKLTPAVRRAVRRATGATVKITVTPKGGKPLRKTLRLKLRRK
jgi:hypothetical protein